MVVGSLRLLICSVLLLQWTECGASYGVRLLSLDLMTVLSHQLLVPGIQFLILRIRTFFFLFF